MCRFLRIFVVLVLQCVATKQEVLIDETTIIESVQGGVGGVAELACDVSPALPLDSLGLVIWYKQGHLSPIYTLDTRDGVTSHWADPATLGTRATFRSETTPAVLILTNLRPEDSGQYRCRVDFIKSPTKNTRLNLTILIPPERLIVLNQDGNEIHNGIIGPYDEGTEVNLTCIAVGGRPLARVSWWLDHSLLANAESRATCSIMISRNHLHNNITCQAVTDPSLSPVTATLSIDVNLRPLWVKVIRTNRPLVAGARTEVACGVAGARPPPSISWWKAGVRLHTATQITSSDGNMTTSVLKFVPSLEDAGRVLSCRAIQPSLPTYIQEDGFTMDVQHTPIVSLELGANLDQNNVVEGSDVYFNCKVKANPTHTRVYFVHSGTIVRPGGGILVHNQSLVVQRVSRSSSGVYVCLADNEIGAGESNAVHLDVKYSPRCKSAQAPIFRAIRGETVQIKCEVDANPKEPMSYYWWFNNSADSKHEISTTSLNSTPNSNGIFNYVVNTSSDYGWVQCFGSNEVGRQGEPCAVRILPAEKPPNVFSCDVTNITYDSLEIVCVPPNHGGIELNYLLEVVDLMTGAILRNVSSKSATFVVSSLSGVSTLAVAVRSYNDRGSSEPFTLTAALLERPPNQTARIAVRIELTTVLVLVLAALGVLASIALCVAGVTCCRSTRKKKKERKNEKKVNEKDKTINTPLTTKDSDSFESLDKNPDIIPLDGRISDNCSNKSSTTDYSIMRPLISKNNSDKYDTTSTQCDSYYDHNPQYVQIRSDLRQRTNYSPNQMGVNIIPNKHNLGTSAVKFGPNIQSIGSNYASIPSIGTTLTNFSPTLQSLASSVTNLGPSIESVGAMNSLQMGKDWQRTVCDKNYEDWLKYKNTVASSNCGMIPSEMSIPEMFPQPLYSHPRLHPIHTLSPHTRLTSYCNASGVDVCTNTLPHAKRMKAKTTSRDTNYGTSSAEQNIELAQMTNKDCG